MSTARAGDRRLAGTASEVRGILDVIASGEQLQAVAAQLPRAIAESIARKYVAKNRGDFAAWEALFECIERNGSIAEAVRLAERLLADNPGSTEARSVAVRVLCNTLRLDRAWDVLNGSDGDLDRRSAIALGQLCLLRDPARARSIFGDILKSEPENLEARLGLANAETVTGAGQRQRLVFYLGWDWHWPIQQPVHEACSGRAMPSVVTTSYWLVRALAPRVLVVSDLPKDVAPLVRHYLPDTVIVHTRHGFADKNYAYYAASAVDFVCVSSRAVADEYAAAGVFEPDRFWVTGYPQLDPLFAKLKAMKKSKPGRTVLFAPTFTRELSAGVGMGADAVRAIRGGDTSITVILRPHPLMRRWNVALLNEWRRQAARELNIEYNDDPDADVSDLILRSDVLVSDVSSLGLLYLAVDRPIVCAEVRPPDLNSPQFAPDGVEWRMRQAADVCSKQSLAVGVQLALSDPGRKAAERRALATYLFGDLTDGRAGRRIARHIAELDAYRCD